MKYFVLALVLMLVIGLSTSCVNNLKTVQGVFVDCTEWYGNGTFFYYCQIGDEHLCIRETEMPDWELGKTYKVIFKDSEKDKYFNEILNWEEVNGQPAAPPMHKVTIEEITPQ
jgi:hypothetical protein